MKLITTFDPSSATSGYIDTLGVNSNEQLMLYNDSLFGLKLTFEDSSYDLIPPMWNKDFILPNIPMGKVQWEVYNTITASGYPISQVYGTLYEPGEHTARVNAGMQRGFTLTGGNIVPSVNTSTLQNSGSSPGTNIITVTPSDASSTWLADNSGNLTIYGDAAGVTTLLLKLIAGTANATDAIQLADLQHIVHVLGALNVDANILCLGETQSFNIRLRNSGIGGTPNIYADTTDGGVIIQMPQGTDILKLEVDGSITALGTKLAGLGSKGVKRSAFDDTGNITYFKAPTNVIFQIPNGTTIATFQSTGLVMSAGDISSANNIRLGSGPTTNNLFLADGSKVASQHIGTGSGSGTFSHGCPKAPQSIMMNVNQAGSATTGYDTVTSTQFHATLGSALSWQFIAHTFN